MDYIIRKMEEDEYPLLRDFLYDAIYVPEGTIPPKRSIVDAPELQLYIAGFGSQQDDNALIAEVDGKAAGAVWVRIMNDYGHVDDETPSLAISVGKEYRGLGIGTALMNTMILTLRKCGYQRVSLSVQKTNYAAKMYQKLGFKICGENEEEYIMIYELGK